MANLAVSLFALVILLISGSLLLWSGFTPISTTVDKLNELNKTCGTGKAFSVPSQWPWPFKEVNQMQKDLSKLGGILVIIGGILSIFPFVGIIGRILAALGSGTGLPQVVIALNACHLWTGQVELILNQLYHLVSTLEGIGMILAVIGIILSNFGSRMHD